MGIRTGASSVIHASQPYRSRSYEKGRDTLVAAERATVDELDLRKEDVAIPRTPKETLTTEDSERGKTAMAAAIREQSERRQLDQNRVRAVYKPMRKEIWLGAALWTYMAVLFYQPATGAIGTGCGMLLVLAGSDCVSAWRSGRDAQIAWTIYDEGRRA